MRKRFSLPKFLVMTVVAAAGASACGTPSQVADSGVNSGASCDAGNSDSCIPDCSSACPICDGDCVFVGDPDTGFCECMA